MFRRPHIRYQKATKYHAYIHQLDNTQLTSRIVSGPFLKSPVTLLESRLETSPFRDQKAKTPWFSYNPAAVLPSAFMTPYKGPVKPSAPHLPPSLQNQVRTLHVQTPSPNHYICPCPPIASLSFLRSSISKKPFACQLCMRACTLPLSAVPSPRPYA